MRKRKLIIGEYKNKQEINIKESLICDKTTKKISPKNENKEELIIRVMKNSLKKSEIKKTQKNKKNEKNIFLVKQKEKINEFIQKIDESFGEIRLKKYKSKNNNFFEQKTNKEISITISEEISKKQKISKKNSFLDNNSSLTIKTQKSSYFSKNSGGKSNFIIEDTKKSKISLKKTNLLIKQRKKKKISMGVNNKNKKNFNFDISKIKKKILPKSCTNKNFRLINILEEESNISLNSLTCNDENLEKKDFKIFLQNEDNKKEDYYMFEKNKKEFLFENSRENIKEYELKENRGNRFSDSKYQKKNFKKVIDSKNTLIKSLKNQINDLIKINFELKNSNNLKKKIIQDYKEKLKKKKKIKKSESIKFELLKKNSKKHLKTVSSSKIGLKKLKHEKVLKNHKILIQPQTPIYNNLNSHFFCSNEKFKITNNLYISQRPKSKTPQNLNKQNFFVNDSQLNRNVKSSPKNKKNDFFKKNKKKAEEKKKVVKKEKRQSLKNKKKKIFHKISKSYKSDKNLKREKILDKSNNISFPKSNIKSNKFPSQKNQNSRNTFNSPFFSKKKTNLYKKKTKFYSNKKKSENNRKNTDVFFNEKNKIKRISNFDNNYQSSFTFLDLNSPKNNRISEKTQKNTENDSKVCNILDNSGPFFKKLDKFSISKKVHSNFKK